MGWEKLVGKAAEGERGGKLGVENVVAKGPAAASSNIARRPK